MVSRSRSARACDVVHDEEQFTFSGYDVDDRQDIGRRIRADLIDDVPYFLSRGTK
ncbi:MAG: hypothetical protein MUF54_00390 [Polyangiaceae bacterium]|nr:hypothetical protein [Polyangiaceae bacterium]